MKNQRQLLLVGYHKNELFEIGKALASQLTVVYAKNTQEAKEILKTNLLISFMIVFIDELDENFEIAQYVKKYSRLSILPVFVIGKDDSYLEEKCLQLGAMDYIKKPFDLQKLIKRVVNIHSFYEETVYQDIIGKDALTQVYNKEHFFHKAKEVLQEYQDVEYDLICFDINRFKLINDLYGISGGDQLLQYIAKLYLEVAKQYQWLIGRLHNDVFAMLVEHGKMSYEEFVSVVSKRLERFESGVKIVLNFGIYPIMDRETPVSVMCDRALMASKSIKGNYETCYKVYQESLRQNIIDEQTIINEMQIALESHQFIPYYQPKYNIETGHVIGFEALVRWKHPQKGIIPPLQFIPLFEANGFISQVDYCIWEQVCQDIHYLIQKGYDVLPVSVNVSRIELYMNIQEKLSQLLKKYDIPTYLVRLEITETAYTKDPEQLIEVVEKLRQQGFAILMDDFGSGYSSLNMLKEVPVDILKLDLRFLKDLQTSGKSEKILESVVVMARKLGLSVIAEGVETEQQIDFLKSIGCLRAQGFYYSRPVPQETLYEIYADSSILKGDTKDSIETIVNIDDVLNNVHKVNDIEWYRSAILKLDAQIFEYDFLTDSMRYYDSYVLPQTGELNKIEVPNYMQKIKEGYHIYPEDIHIVYDILSGCKESKKRIRAKPYFTNEGYQWYDVITHTIYDEYGNPSVAVGVMRNISEYKLNEISLFALSHFDTHRHPQQVINEVWTRVGKELYFDAIYGLIRQSPTTKVYQHFSNDIVLQLLNYQVLSSQQQSEVYQCFEKNQGIIVLQDSDKQEFEYTIFQEYFTKHIQTVILVPIMRKQKYVGETVFLSKERRVLTESEKNILIEIGKYMNTYMDTLFFETQLQEKNALYNVMMDNMYGGVLMLEVTPNSQKGIFGNKFFYRLYGFDENESIEEIDVMGLLLEDDCEIVTDTMLKAIETNSLQSCVYRGRRLNGDVLNLEMKAQYISEMHSQNPVVLVMIDNISERIHREHEVEISEIKYRLALEKTYARLWDYHIKTKQLYRSKTIQEETKTTAYIDNVPDYFIENQLIHPEYQKGYLDFYQKVSQGEDCDYLFKAMHKDGIYKWVHIAYHVLFDENGLPDHAIGVGEDINEVYENKMKLQQEQYYAAIMHGTRIYYDVNLTQNSIVYNDERLIFKDMHEYTYTRFLEFVSNEFVSPNDYQNFYHQFSPQYIMTLFKNGQTFFSVEYKLGSNNKRWYEIDVSLYTPDQTHDICAFITIRDIDDRKRYELSLEFNAKHDDLTGVYTRNAIQKYVNNIIQKKEIALMMIDVNDFKLINDNFGHVYGDDTLKNIADVLSHVIHNKGIVGRMGGDEFVAIIEDYHDEEEIIDMVKRIHESIHLTYMINQEEHTLSCSIGVAYSQMGASTFDDLYHQADQRLYHMKRITKV